MLKLISAILNFILVAISIGHFYFGDPVTAFYLVLIVIVLTLMESKEAE